MKIYPLQMEINIFQIGKEFFQVRTKFFQMKISPNYRKFRSKDHFRFEERGLVNTS